MAVKADHVESEPVGSVCDLVRDDLPSEDAKECVSFVRQYYQWVPRADLTDRSPVDLYGAAKSPWCLLHHRAAGETKIRVYDPDFERDGWQSPHTVLDIVSDDMPFVVDSVTMELRRQGFPIHLVIHPVLRVGRDEQGELVEVLDPDESEPNTITESVLHAEVSREGDFEQLAQLEQSIERVLEEVRAAVEDWQPMRRRAQELVEELERDPPPVEPDEAEEAKAFLRWLAEDHFTFLGYREYDLMEEGDEVSLKAVPRSGMGILRRRSQRPSPKLSADAISLARSPHLLVLTKANSRATVHRPAYLDYIGVKRFGADGEVIGERRFLGLYTTAAYKASARSTPLLRGKVEGVLQRAAFPPASHDRKALTEILESYPRDSLFQMDTEELFDVAVGILGLGERQRLRLFVWPDPLGRFVECLVCIPRERFNTENRERVGRILLDAFTGTQLDWNLQLSESVLARVHYIVRCADGVPAEYDVAQIEERLVYATRAWTEELRGALVDEFGAEEGRLLFRRYERAFPPAYRSDVAPRAALADVIRMEEVAQGQGPLINLYRPAEALEGMIRCKLLSTGRVFLSDVLPTFEHMGAKVVDERPYEMTPREREPIWLYDFGLRCAVEDAERVRDIFQGAFLDAWRGELEDDGLNGLVLGASLTGRQITIIRAIAKYLRQAGIAFSDAYMVRTLTRHPDVALLLVKLFTARFDPDAGDRKEAEELAEQIESAIDAVQSLDEDRILRSFLAVVQATLRTNYFCVDDQGLPRPHLSFKLNPTELQLLPLPRPRFEIFVYSPRVEGVHLRGGSAARGGIRWSDRPEDFRTEILGLMKAQMVKNALIVPVGAKGGFVVKHPPEQGGREALREEATWCYRTFLSGLLDVTDNFVGDRVLTPDRVVRYDGDDPYLVVAADKGTAAFSDIANEISATYDFWLGDAFASGGSLGYDHKQMGITARGAWESVKRHFRELGTDVQSTDFTVVGIGDMSGDVFGNGMLLSPHIKLVGAFNHQHVFLDPEPDPERSFKERKRLFEKQRSSWSDYEESLISEGGGVYPRNTKSIPISSQMRDVLEIEDEELSPPELIRALLRAPVDLLWNGGIGTYVKASSETHADAGDKSTDAVRVDGRDMRCRVVGEGGNLGFTQRGRIEYGRAGGPECDGGRINTDAIDNVAGVSCSDHEVNIKILLRSLVDKGELNEEQRNQLLVEMTDAVAERVLYGSYVQTQAISLAMAQAASMINVHARLIRYLEQEAELNRELEFLPSEDELAERRAAHEGLAAPELAVVMAYCKIHLYAQLLESDLQEDPFLGNDLERYFPSPLPERYGKQMGRHRLRREIIATVVANQLVDRAGTTFAFRLGEETGVSARRLARAYAVARDVFEMRSFWSAVQELDNEIDASLQLEMLIDGRKLVERSTRWLVRDDPGAIDVERTIRRFAPGAETLARVLPEVLAGGERDGFEARVSELEGAGVPGELAARVASMPSMVSVFDILKVAEATKRDQDAVMKVYFRLGSRLGLGWLRDRIIELPRANRWQALARAALRDDLYNLYRELTQSVIESGQRGQDSDAVIEAWSERNAEAVERCLTMLADIKGSGTFDTTTLPVALREVRNLITGGADGAPAAESVTMAG